MRKVYFVVIACALSRIAAAQSQGVNISLTTGAGFLFNPNPSHAVTTSFPYTTTAAGGTQKFSGSLQGDYHSLAPMFDLPGLDVTYRRLDFSIGTGLRQDFNNDYAWYGRTAISYAFPLHWATVKPGVGLIYFGGRRERLGSIDNRGQDLTMFDFTAYSQFVATYTYDDGYGDFYSYDQTYNADHLDVDYSTHSLDIGPQVDLAFPSVGRFTFSLQAGWLFPVIQQSALRFVQVSYDNYEVTTNPVETIKQPHNGSLGGVFGDARVAFSLGHIRGNNEY